MATTPVPTGPNVRQVTARHRLRHHFRDTPSALHGIVSAACQRRSHDPKKGSGAMTALWSSPESRRERRAHRGHSASCAAERLLEQPPRLDGHPSGEYPEGACAVGGNAIVIGRAELVRSVERLVTAAA